MKLTLVPPTPPELIQDESYASDVLDEQKTSAFIEGLVIYLDFFNYINRCDITLKQALKNKKLLLNFIEITKLTNNSK